MTDKSAEQILLQDILPLKAGINHSLKERYAFAADEPDNHYRMHLFFNQQIDEKIAKALLSEEGDAFGEVKQSLTKVASIVAPELVSDLKAPTKKSFFALQESKDLAFALLPMQETYALKNANYKIYVDSREALAGSSRKTVEGLKIKKVHVQDLADEVKTWIEAGNNFFEGLSPKLKVKLGNKITERLDTVSNVTADLKNAANRLNSARVNASVCTLFGATAFSLSHMMNDFHIPTNKRLFFLDQTSHAAVKYYQSLLEKVPS